MSKVNTHSGQAASLQVAAHRHSDTVGRLLSMYRSNFQKVRLVHDMLSGFCSDSEPQRSAQQTVLLP